MPALNASLRHTAQEQQLGNEVQGVMDLFARLRANEPIVLGGAHVGTAAASDAEGNTAAGRDAGDDMGDEMDLSEWLARYLSRTRGGRASTRATAAAAAAARGAAAAAADVKPVASKWSFLLTSENLDTDFASGPAHMMVCAHNFLSAQWQLWCRVVTTLLAQVCTDHGVCERDRHAVIDGHLAERLSALFVPFIDVEVRCARTLF